MTKIRGKWNGFERKMNASAITCFSGMAMQLGDPSGRKSCASCSHRLHRRGILTSHRGQHALAEAPAFLPEIDRLMADAHKRRFDLMIVRKFDRLPRT